MSRRHLHRGIVLAMLAGLVLAGVLISREGFSQVLDTCVRIGWGLAAVVLVHVLQFVLCGLAWRSLVRNRGPARLSIFIYGRWIREAVNSLLPLIQVGGEVVGSRFLALRGAAVPVAAGSVVVDLTLEVVSQCVFIGLGLCALILIGHQGPVVHWALLGLAVAIPMVGGFLVAQKRGMLRVLEGFVARLQERWPALGNGELRGLHDTVAGIYTERGALLRGCIYHLMAWVLGSAEVWVILHFLGVGRPLAVALVIESLGQGIRSAAFIIPGGFGAQEGGYLLLAGVFGLPPDVGLAISLIKRAREVLLGLPGLFFWQAAEGRRLWQRWSLEGSEEGS